MAVVLSNVNTEAGLKKLDEYLLTRSYISGYVVHHICEACLLSICLCFSGCSYALQNRFPLGTLLQKMTWLCSLHFHLLPNQALSMSQGGMIISVLSWGPGVCEKTLMHIILFDLCFYHVRTNVTFIQFSVEWLQRVKVSRLSHLLLLWHQLLKSVTKRLEPAIYLICLGGLKFKGCSSRLASTICLINGCFHWWNCIHNQFIMSPLCGRRAYTARQPHYSYLKRS
jgi:hypothetical protein